MIFVLSVLADAISKARMRINTLSKALLILLNFVVVVILFVLVFIGLKKIFDESGNCSESLQYSGNLQKIQLNETLANAYPKYSLFYYNPSGSANNRRFKGIPAVYIHGHAGSPYNGIMLASDAYIMAGLLGKINYDFFMMDLNKEISAIYYKFIEDQTKFTYECVKFILSLYPLQKSVVVFGHSMGGVVAMGMVTSADFQAESVAAFILLASPQQMPIVNLDRRLNDHYNDFQRRWRDGELKESIAVVSIGGGEDDLLVRMSLTSLSRINSDNKLLWTSTTSFPDLWNSVQHIEFLGCKELNEALARSLFDIVDDANGRITDNRTLIRSVFKQHFTPDHIPPTNESSSINNSLVWNEVDLPWSLQDHQPSPGYVVIKLSGRSTGIIIMSDTNVTNWIGGCNSPSGTKCITMSDLSTKGFILPSPSYAPMKFINLSPEDLKSFDDLVISYLETNNLRIEAMTEENFKSVSVWSLVTSDKLLLNGSSHFFYNISLDRFTDILQAFTVNIELSSSCKGSGNEFIIFKFYIPWGDPSVHHVIKQSPGEFYLKLVSNRPSNSNEQPQLQVFIPSKCVLNVSLTPSFWGVIQQFTMFYVWFVLQFFVLQILIYLQRQHCQLIVDDKIYRLLSIPLFVLSWLLIPIVILWKMFSRGVGLHELIKKGVQWEDDIDLLYDINSWDPAGYITMFFLSFIFMPLFMNAFKLFVYLAVKFGTYLGNKLFPSPERLEKFKKVMIIVLYSFPVIELILALSTCGAFSLLLNVMFYVLKVCFSNRNLESFVQFNSSLFMLSVFHFFLNSTTFYLWASGLEKFSVFTDPSLLHGIIASISHFVIGFAFYQPSERRYQFLAFTVLMQIILFFDITHASVSMFAASYVIDAALIVFAIHASITILMKYFPPRRRVWSVEAEAA